MGAQSDYFGNNIIDHMLRNQAFSPPTAIYVALYTTLPTASSSGVEVSGGGYARQALTLQAAAAQASQNSAAITYPTASADWGLIVGAAIVDAATGGNILLFGGLTATKTVDNGDTFQIADGNLTLQYT